MSARPLTNRQRDVLLIVSQNAPLAVRDVFYCLPGFTETDGHILGSILSSHTAPTDEVIRWAG